MELSLLKSYTLHIEKAELMVSCTASLDWFLKQHK